MNGTTIDERMQKERSGYWDVWMKLKLGTAIQRVVTAAESHSPPKAPPKWKECCGQGRCRYVIRYKIYPHSQNGEWKSLWTFHDFTKNCLEDKHLPTGWTWEGPEKRNRLGISQASKRFMLYIHAPVVSPTPTSKYLLFLPLLHRVT